MQAHLFLEPIFTNIFFGLIRQKLLTSCIKKITLKQKTFQKLLKTVRKGVYCPTLIKKEILLPKNLLTTIIISPNLRISRQHLQYRLIKAEYQ